MAINPQAAASYSAQVQQAAAARYAEAQADNAAQAARLNMQLQHTPTPVRTTSSSTRGLDSNSSAKSISLDRLFQDYAKNGLNADEEYKGQTYNIGGMIKTIHSDEHGPVVELEVPCEDGGCWARRRISRAVLA